MKQYKQINNWTIKEKSLDEIPHPMTEENRFAVFAPDGRWMEDNLTLEQAEEYCNENLDFVKTI
jgi:hypothetical protein